MRVHTNSLIIMPFVTSIERADPIFRLFIIFLKTQIPSIQKSLPEKIIFGNDPSIVSRAIQSPLLQ